MRACLVAISFALLFSTSGCAAAGLGPSKAPQTGEAFCAAIPSIGYGNFFYCATAQSNLQAGLPNGLLGYCETANTNSIGLVGYSAITTNGGAFPVTSFSNAQAACDSVNFGSLRQCNTIVRCTRE
jgi:hypothetical protein